MAGYGIVRDMRALLVPAPLVLTLLGSCQLASTSDLPASFSVRAQTLHDTRTAEEGSVELEAGAESDPFDGLEFTGGAAFGLGPATEGFVEGAPYTDPDGAGSGVGDLVLGVRHRIREQDDRNRPSVALQFEAKLPTAEEGDNLGSGEVDMGLAVLASRTWKDNWIWWGYRAGFLGEPAAAGFDLEHTLAMGGARKLRSGVGGLAEVDWVQNHEQGMRAGTVKVGGIIALVKDWQLDVGMSMGFGGGNEGERVFIGVTRAVAGLWR